jgi:hypothetical protein
MGNRDAFDSSSKPDPELDEVASSEELKSLQFWLQAFDEEASRFAG